MSKGINCPNCSEQLKIIKKGDVLMGHCKKCRENFTNIKASETYGEFEFTKVLSPMTPIGPG